MDNKTLNEFMNDHKVENTASYKAYTSTTKSESNNDMANVRIYINNTKKGKDISSIGLDEEALYQNDSDFLTISKKKINGVYHIKLKEIFNG